MAVSPGGRPADASPLGKKAGPRGLTDYTREIAHALMRRGIPESRAIAIARSQQGKWALKSKNPNIRAASAASLAAQHVLDHRKRGKRDLSWSAFDAARPPGQPKAPAAQPAPAQRQPAAAPAPDPISPRVHKNIAAFQKAHGLPATGNVDAATVAWLNNPKNKAAASQLGPPKAKLTTAQKFTNKAKAASKKEARVAKAAANKKAAARRKAVASFVKRDRSYKASAKHQQQRTAAAGKAAAKNAYANAGVAATRG